MRDNPRWTKWPFRGWREDTAASFIGCVLWLMLLACLAAHGCGKLPEIVWPTASKCLTLPAESLVSKASAIVARDGLDAVFSQQSVAALEDLAREYGPDAVVCVLGSVVDRYLLPKRMAALPPENVARGKRVQSFLEQKGVEPEP